MVDMRNRRRRGRPFRRLGARAGQGALLDSLAPRQPVGTLLRQARLRRLRRSLAFTRRIVTELYEEISGLEKFVQSALDEEEKLDGYVTTEPGVGYEEEDEVGYGTVDDSPGGKPRPPRSAAASTATAPEKLSPREQALERIFRDLEGEKADFTKEGTPRVDAVSERLESLDHEPASRAEVDRAYAAYERRRASQPARRSRLTERQKGLWATFDDMWGEKDEFTQEGRPKVASVNNRLESLHLEPSTREEIEAAFKKYQGE